MTGIRVERARSELDAARHLAAGGFAAQAISRAYYDEVTVSREEANAAIANAERFVDAVEGWLARER